MCPLSSSRSQSSGGSGREITSCRRFDLSSFQRSPRIALTPSHEEWGQEHCMRRACNSAWGWGCMPRKASSRVVVSHCATALLHARYPSAWGGSFSVSLHALCPSFVAIAEHLPESVLHRGGGKLNPRPVGDWLFQSL